MIKALIFFFGKGDGDTITFVALPVSFNPIKLVYTYGFTVPERLNVENAFLKTGTVISRGSKATISIEMFLLPSRVVLRL